MLEDQMKKYGKQQKLNGKFDPSIPFSMEPSFGIPLVNIQH